MYVHMYNKCMCKYTYTCTWFLDARLSDVYGVDTHLNSSQLIQSGVLEFSISDDYMFAVKDHVS